MVQRGESESFKGKTVVVDSSEPQREFECPRCSKIFFSVPALCGHQNAHRLVKDPMTMSPVLAAVLNNPLPPHDKPFLISLRSKQPGAAANLSPCYHPYRRLEKEPIQFLDKLMNQTSRGYDNYPHKKPEGEDFLSQLLQKEPYYRPCEMVVPEYDQENSNYEYLTMDLLREWMPISNFGDHGHLGKSSGEIISHPFSRNYLMEVELDLQIGPRTTSTGHLDLELKL